MGIFTENPLLNSMACLCASIDIMFEERATFVFHSWFCITNQDGVLHRELRDDASPTISSPVRIMPHQASTNSNPNTISGAYLIRRSKWRSKRRSALTRVGSGDLDFERNAPPGHHQARLPTGLKITTRFDQGAVTRIVTTIPREVKPKTTPRLNAGRFKTT